MINKQNFKAKNNLSVLKKGCRDIENKIQMQLQEP